MAGLAMFAGEEKMISQAFGLFGLVGRRIGCIELPVGHTQAVRGAAAVDRLAGECAGDGMLRGIPGGNSYYAVAVGGVEPGDIIRRLIDGIDNSCRERSIRIKGDVELRRRLEPQQEAGSVGCCSHIGIDRKSTAAFGVSIGIGGSLKAGCAESGGDSIGGAVGLLASRQGGA